MNHRSNGIATFRELKRVIKIKLADNFSSYNNLHLIFLKNKATEEVSIISRKYALKSTVELINIDKIELSETLKVKFNPLTYGRNFRIPKIT